MTYVRRAIVPRILEALENLPVVVLTGLRQSGKSTLLASEAALSRRRYVTLDDFEMLEAARRDPDGFVKGSDPLTIDEAQRAPELLVAIKRDVDRDRRPGRFLLSGSASVGLLSAVSESLAGRAVALSLEPMTRREIKGGSALPLFLRHLWDAGEPPSARKVREVSLETVLRGGLPPVALRQVKKPSLWLRGYEQTYLERDVRDVTRVGDLLEFRSLLRLAALRTAQILNASELARDARLSAATASRYLGALEASFVTRRLQPFLGNKTSRLVKSPKLFVTDSGLAAHLCDVDVDRPDADDPAAGALLETYVAQCLAGDLGAHWPEARLSYWHVQGRYEVDFVVEARRRCVAVEVKRAPRWQPKDLSGLQAFLARTPSCRAAVLAYGGKETVSLGDRLFAAPVGSVLS